MAGAVLIQPLSTRRLAALAGIAASITVLVAASAALPQVTRTEGGTILQRPGGVAPGAGGRPPLPKPNDCMSRRMWEVWQTTAEGRRATQLPLTPWTSYTQGGPPGNVDLYQLPDNHQILVLSSGEVLEQLPNGSYRQDCPPPASPAAASTNAGGTAAASGETGTASVNCPPGWVPSVTPTRDGCEPQERIHSGVHNYRDSDHHNN